MRKRRPRLGVYRDRPVPSGSDQGMDGPMATREPSARLFQRWLEPTWQPDPPLPKTLAQLPPGARICDLGAGGRRLSPETRTVDVTPGPEVDVVADIHHVPLPDQSFELVVCTGTLNLCRDPGQVAKEMARLLVPGGWVHLEIGLFQPYLPEPEDYHRFTLPGLRLLFGQVGIEERRSGAHIGPMSALSTAALYLVADLLPGPAFWRRGLRGASHLAFGPLKYLDAALPQATREQGPFAYGIYFVGQKAP